MSALGQTLRDLEVIVVDDGSSDDTLELLSGIGDDRLKVISLRHQERSAARNHGIWMAAGEYVAFLDADDWWTPDKLERQIALFRANQRLALAYCWLQPVGPDGKLYQTLRGSVEAGRAPGARLFDECIMGMPTATSAMLVRRDCLDAVGPFQTGLNYGEDWELCLRLACNHEIGFVPDALTFYRLHGMYLPAKQNALGMQQALCDIVKSALAQAGRFPQESLSKKAQARVLCLGSFVDAAMGDFRIANNRLSEARQLTPEAFAGSMPQVLEMLADFGNHLYDTDTPMEEAASVVTSYLEHLAGENQDLASRLNRTLGLTYAIQVFHRARFGTRQEVRKAFGLALKHDAAWLKNGGLLKLGAKAWLSMQQPDQE